MPLTGPVYLPPPTPRLLPPPGYFTLPDPFTRSSPCPMPYSFPSKAPVELSPPTSRLLHPPRIVLLHYPILLPLSGSSPSLVPPPPIPLSNFPYAPTTQTLMLLTLFPSNAPAFSPLSTPASSQVTAPPRLLYPSRLFSLPTVGSCTIPDSFPLQDPCKSVTSHTQTLETFQALAPPDHATFQTHSPSLPVP